MRKGSNEFNGGAMNGRTPKTTTTAAGMFLLTAALIFGGVFSLNAAELRMFPNATLTDSPANDGDSFILKSGKESFHARLYFVDCPETSARHKSDAERVREQMRYFGLPSPSRVIHFGNEAKIFSRRALSRPFTFYTARAKAPGRSSKGRVYGFVVTENGDDLGSLLVKNGLARRRGLGRKTPSGITRDEMFKRLDDLEISAAWKHMGAWSESDPERIAALRAAQRSEDQKLKELQSQIKKAGFPKGLINLNTASKEHLTLIPGIGPVLADRIIAGRPYKMVDDLVKVKGVGPKALEKIRPHVVAD
jgi:competence protein ComEA